MSRWCWDQTKLVIPCQNVNKLIESEDMVESDRIFTFLLNFKTLFITNI